ncbi:MAG: hypothetical protein JNK82_38440 [Myxococcaceae bacterium]|nr:hypothetical protein [Myxococcaceae bacterium]
MKNSAIALAVSFALGFALSASSAAPRSIAPPSEAPKCKAAGQPCDDKEDCCSRMCRKDNKRCA